NDVLLYLPVHDKWQTADGLLMPFDTEGRWMESLPFHETAMKLWEKGYGFDAVSDRQLADAKVEGGNKVVNQVVLGGNRYWVIVVPGCGLMSPATLRKLAELARSGAWVIFSGGDPKDVPGLGDLEKRRAELRAGPREGLNEVRDVAAYLAQTILGREEMVDLG